MQGRVIKLRKLFPILNPLVSLDVIGFQEGTYTIFISIDMDVFAVMLRSEQVKKVGKTGSKYAMAPYVSFYTPGTGLVLIFNLRTLYIDVCVVCDWQNFSQTDNK